SWASLGRIRRKTISCGESWGTSKRLPGIGDRGACWPLSTRLSPRRRLTGLKAVAHALWGREDFREVVRLPSNTLRERGQTPPDCNRLIGSGATVTTADVYPAS